jgi:hypothetical protein
MLDEATAGMSCSSSFAAGISEYSKVATTSLLQKPTLMMPLQRTVQIHVSTTGGFMQHLECLEQQPSLLRDCIVVLVFFGWQCISNSLNGFFAGKIHSLHRPYACIAWAATMTAIAAAACALSETIISLVVANGTAFAFAVIALTDAVAYRVAAGSSWASRSFSAHFEFQSWGKGRWGTL